MKKRRRARWADAGLATGLLLAFSLTTCLPASASPDPVPEAAGATGAAEVAAAAGAGAADEEWILVGDFRGSSGRGLTSRLGNLLFEAEAGGSLYQDLSDASLGLSFDEDDWRVDWDNSFSRRIVQVHRELAPGELVMVEDVSSFISVNTLVSRGRASFDYISDVVNEGGVGLQVEGGYGTAMALRQEPVVFGDRPLDEVLRERGRGSERIPVLPRSGDPGLLNLAARGVAKIAEAVSAAVGRRFVDTERGALFYEGYAEPITLFIDYGLPVEAELFLEQDPRISVGDRVTHTTFLGISPVSADFRELGLETSFRHFYRFLRETTVIKDDGDRVRVRVRNNFSRGYEIIPLKLRPEIRLLGILKLGYTFLQLLYDRYGEAASDITYGIDLSDPSGMESFRALLGQSQSVRLGGVLRAAQRRDGVEILSADSRHGKVRFWGRLLRFFSWYRLGRDRMSRVHRVRIGEFDGHELFRGHWASFRKGFGQSKMSRRWLVVSLRGEMSETSIDRRSIRGAQREKSPPDGDGERELVMSLEAGLRSEGRLGPKARRMFLELESIVAGMGEAPLELAALAVAPEEEAIQVAGNIRLSLGWEQLQRLASVSEDEMWAELAEILLGPEHRAVWGSGAQRALWLPSARRSSSDRHISEVFDARYGPALRGSPIAREQGSRWLFIRASRIVKRLARLQELIREDRCWKCFLDVTGRRREARLLQLMLVKMAGGVGDGGVGYRAELFTDRMPQPLLVTNGVIHEVRREDAADQVESITTLDRDFRRRESPVTVSNARFRAGRVALRRGARSVASEESCLRLRLLSDLRFDRGIRLRLDVRESHAGVDEPLALVLLDMVAPAALTPTPFEPSRFAYDFLLPLWEELEGGGSYTLLMRGLNPAGLPVTEEQQIRFSIPTDWYETMAPVCSGSG